MSSKKATPQSSKPQKDILKDGKNAAIPNEPSTSSKLSGDKKKMVAQYGVITKCKLCRRQVVECESLVVVLVAEQRAFITRANGVKRFFNIYVCRVCNLMLLDYNTMKAHVKSHLHANEIFYCISCQDAINSVRLNFGQEFGEDPSPMDINAIIESRKKLIHTNLENKRTASPCCGSCNKEFGYTIPLIHKIVERKKVIVRIEEEDGEQIEVKYRYVCNICGKREENKICIQMHAVSHIINKEVYCTLCDSENREKIEKAKKIELVKTWRDARGSYDENELEPTDVEYANFNERILELSTMESSDSAGEEGDDNIKQWKMAREKKMKQRKKNLLVLKADWHHRQSIVDLTDPKVDSKAILPFLDEADRLLGSLAQACSSPEWETMWPCKKCGKSLDDLEVLLRNMSTNKSVDSKNVKKCKTSGHFSCMVCDFSCENILEMDKHVANVHIQNDEMYCVKCIKDIKDKGSAELSSNRSRK